MGNSVERIEDPDERVELREGEESGSESASHVALDVESGSDGGDGDGDGDGAPRALNVYFGQVFAALSGGDDDEILGFPPTRPDDEATHPLTTLAQLSSQVSSTTTVTSAMNLNRDTLRLVPSSAVPSAHTLEFFIDASSPLLLEFYTAYDENATAPSKPFHVSTVSPGIGVPFHDPSLTLDLHTWRTEDLRHTEASGRHPLAIKAQPKQVNGAGEVEVQWTFAEILKAADDAALELRTTKQTVRVSGLTYVVHDIFGINHADPLSPVKEDCVICLTEVRDTVVIPCRHLCVCHMCAQVLRYQSNKCPICRGPARAMLRLEITPIDDTNDDLSGEETKVAISSSTSPPPKILLDQGASLL